MFFAFFSFLAFCIFQSANTFIYPWHASCKINWNIPVGCDGVKEKLILQMNTWQGDANCGAISDQCPALPCGQNCLYNHTGTDADGTVRGIHLTPVKRYSDSLSFKFEATGNTCKVEAFSSSDLWYAYLDFGTNYCNLRNLLDGTGLSVTEGFTEETEDSVCTQYTSRDCSRY